MSARRRGTRLPAAGRPRGYVLLFVLGLLIVVSTLVLGTSSSLRLDARLLAHEKDALQDDYLLEGAARLAATQLEITKAVDGLQLPANDERLRNWQAWRPDGSTHELKIAVPPVRVTLTDISGLPDANLLLPREWERLFLLLGAPNPQAARDWAQAVVQMRGNLLSMRGGSGFGSLRELLGLPLLPRDIVEGGTERTPLGLRDLIVVGSRSKAVDLEKTPVVMIQALGEVSDTHLQALMRLRQEAPLSAAARQAWVQGTGLTAIQPAAQPTAVRAVLHLGPGAGDGRNRIAIITGDNTGFRVADLFSHWTVARPRQP